MWRHQSKTVLATRLAISLVSVSAAVGCGNSPSSPTAPATNTFHAEVTDPIGDGIVSAGAPNPPDLIRGIVDVSGGTIVFTVQLASGTLDSFTTRVGIPLDTDQLAATGINAWGMGVDYLVDLWAPTKQAMIEKSVPTGTGTPSNPYYVNVGVAPLSIVADAMTVTVPLSLLGNTSGRLNFRMFAYALASGSPVTPPTTVADVMPDINLPTPHAP